MKYVYATVFIFLSAQLYAFQPNDSLINVRKAQMNVVAEMWKTSGFDDTMMCSFYCKNFNRRPAYIHNGLFPVGSMFDFKNAQPGQLLGPYVDGNCISLYKFIDRVNKPDSARFSQILVAYKGAKEAGPEVTRSKENARKRADSLCFELRMGKIFMDEIMVMETDDVEGIMRNRGNYGWLTRSSKYPQCVIDAVFETPPGSFVITESERGYHVIGVEAYSEILDCYRAWEIKWCIDSCYDFHGNQVASNAVYPGGKEALDQFLQTGKQKYDSLEVEGEFDVPVMVFFDVLPDGSVGRVGVLRQSWITPAMVLQITHLLRSMPKWQPAETCAGSVVEEQVIVLYL